MALVNTTPELLSELKLHGIKESLPKRLEELAEQQWSPSEFLNLCLEDEKLHRQNLRLLRRLKAASFPIVSSLENFDLTVDRKLRKSTIRELAGASFVTQGTNILIAGPTGVGKTHLACALGQAACRQGFSTLFFSLNRLLEKMALVRAQGRYLSLLKKLTAASVIVLDDFGLRALTPPQLQDIYDLVDGRVESLSTIVTTQLPVENWREILPDPVLCDAITDRIVQKAIILEMEGESYRKKRFKGSHTDPP
jgi:DNA replication protein DnaC|uniref:IstB domain protein ATP-binding protein n=1 Tax=Leptospirillum ferrodiazotrophum TaxID=412449 RepID=C6HUE6_9BACT|nr:MAG: IstB domain protein ATP-binding protein [Leptospirillum ferrodiazotrophum]